MENHPIPQDVTGFQFKLIGDMTIKQFAYVAVGVIFGWLFFVLPIPAFIKFPFALLCVGTGVSFAFLPFEGRPLDTMVFHFAQALFIPNQYIYQKIGGNMGMIALLPKAVLEQSQTNAQSSQKLQLYLQSIPHATSNAMDEKEMVFFKSIASISTNPNATPTMSAPAPVAVPTQPIQVVMPQSAQAPQPQEPNLIEMKLREQAILLQTQLQEAKASEQKQKDLGGNAESHQKVLTLEEQLKQIVEQKTILENQLLEMSKKLQAQQRPTVFTPTQGVAKQETMLVRKIPKSMGVTAGLPNASEYPNILAGIIKDPRGNILPNILVEVRDGDGNPVRAFKTNSLGQFASATPLLNGTYTLIFEDKALKNKFDAVEIQATGDLISPIEIISMDQREELRKDLFG